MDVVSGTHGTCGSETTRFTAPLLWPSSCADFLKVLTNSTFIWRVIGPRENLLWYCLPDCDAEATMANEKRMDIWVVFTAQNFKSLGYVVSIFLTAKGGHVLGDSLPHTLQCSTSDRERESCTEVEMECTSFVSRNSE